MSCLGDVPPCPRPHSSIRISRRRPAMDQRSLSKYTRRSLQVNQQCNPENHFCILNFANIVVNASDVREIKCADVADGQGRAWKIAMWGSPADKRVLGTTEARFSSIGDLEKTAALIVSQGPEFIAANVAT